MGRVIPCEIVPCSQTGHNYARVQYVFRLWLTLLSTKPASKNVPRVHWKRKGFASLEVLLGIVQCDTSRRRLIGSAVRTRNIRSPRVPRPLLWLTRFWAHGAVATIRTMLTSAEFKCELHSVFSDLVRMILGRIATHRSHCVLSQSLNHVSPRWEGAFVSRKVTRAAAKIHTGFEGQPFLGSHDAEHDGAMRPNTLRPCDG